jgi:hypothetical protein
VAQPRAGQPEARLRSRRGLRLQHGTLSLESRCRNRAALRCRILSEQGLAPNVECRKRTRAYKHPWLTEGLWESRSEIYGW